MSADLTAKEQEHVRAALRFIHAKCGTWANTAKALRSPVGTLRHVTGGGTASASIAVRVARFGAVGVDDVLTGRFPPPGACCRCGHIDEPSSAVGRREGC
jgi:hypothetical protein